MEKDTQSSDLVNSAKEEVIDEILHFTASRVGYRLVSAVQLKKTTRDCFKEHVDEIIPPRRTTRSLTAV